MTVLGCAELAEATLEMVPAVSMLAQGQCELAAT